MRREELAADSRSDTVQITSPRVLEGDQTAPLPLLESEEITRDACWLRVEKWMKRGADLLNGTGTLIGPRHVLTAAHVIEALGRREKQGLGHAVFVLPSGETRQVVHAELNGVEDPRLNRAIRKLPSFDLGIAQLDRPFDGPGFVRWGVFDESAFDARVHVTGYDREHSDFAKPPAGCIRGLITRSGGVRPLHITRNLLATLGLSGGVVFGRGRRPSLPGALGGAVAGGLVGSRFDSDGWTAERFVWSKGASGAPIWAYQGREPIVIGVTSGKSFVDTYNGARISDFHARMIGDYVSRMP